jgi:hypothetical protein
MDDAEPTSSDADTARADPTPNPSPPSFAHWASAFAKASADKSPGKQGGGEADTHSAAELHDAPAHDKKKINWPYVRRIYELTAIPTVEILKRFGLTESQLRHRRESEGWQPRPSVAGERRRADSFGRLRERMLTVLSILLGRIEEGVVLTNTYDHAHAEGLCTLAAGWGSLQTAEEGELSMPRHAMKARETTSIREKKNNDAGYDFRDDPVWLVDELNRRLDRLHGQDEAAGAGQAPDRAADAGARGGLAAAELGSAARPASA